MVPKEEGQEDGNSLSSARTSESSDSYSYLLRGFDTPGNGITEEWEAIERTLYQESGKHVTDPTLLKECKLWRETFPHIRVTGTGIKASEESGHTKDTKDVEVSDKNKLALCKLNEKREKIKKTVVSQIVERLIKKLNSNAGAWEGHADVNNKILELNGKEDKKSVFNMNSFGVKQEKESYFERGKGLGSGGILKHGNTKPEHKNPLSDIFDNFEYEPSKTPDGGSTAGIWSGSNYYQAKEPTTRLAKNERIMRSGNLKFEIAEKHSSTRRPKNDRPSNSLSNVHKPFEATKKIDKKYEAMLERILENNGIRDSGRSSVSIGCGDDSSGKRSGFSTGRKTKELPRINSFTNNWLSRAEENLSDSYGYNLSVARNGDTIGNPQRLYKSQALRTSGDVGYFNDRILEELAREVNEFAISGGRDHGVIRLERPKLHGKYNSGSKTKTQKSASCSDLPKKNPRPKINRVLKNTLEKGKSELNVKSGGKKTEKNGGNQNVQLPPIETSIICTEIVARPNASVRTYTKKY